MNSIIIKRVFSFTLSILLIVNPVMVPVYVYAEDSVVTPEAPKEETVSTPEPPSAPAVIQSVEPPPSQPAVITTEPPKQTENISSSTVTTGESVASGTQEVTANTTIAEVSGSVSVDGCSVSVTSSCPIDSVKEAVVEGSVTADSVSGENTITDVPGDALTKTGTASATIVSKTELNTTIIEASPSASGPTGSSGSSGASGVETDVTLDNSVQLSSDLSSSAVSGKNTEENVGNDAVISSGGSSATAYSLNILNTTLMGSSVKFLVINIDSTQVGNINLNALWRDIQKEQAGRKTVFMDGDGSVVDITNSSSTFVRVAASAISGENVASDVGGDAIITSGNAFASAGLVNIENSTIIESQILVVVINILGSLVGDIILPSTERFTEVATTSATLSGSSHPETLFSNSAYVTDSVMKATADSGNNTETGKSENQYIGTGDAYAFGNESVFANMSMYIDYYYKILFNNYGYHSGGVSGLIDPEETVATEAFRTTTYDVASDYYASQKSSSEAGSGSTTLTNTSQSSYDVEAFAKSGGNEALDVDGNAYIKTGTSVALANVVSFLNTTVFGNYFLFPIVNLFGSWTGNFVLERPDVEVTMRALHGSVLPGEDVEYQVEYMNNTGEEARDVTLEISLPPDLSYSSTNFSIEPAVNGNIIQFRLGTVNGKSIASFVFRAHVTSEVKVTDSSPITLLQKIKHAVLPVVYAAEQEKLEIIHVKISTSDVESNSKNNEASVETTVIIPEVVTTPLSSPIPPSYDARLQVSSSNNSGDFVYPGQTVHFTVSLVNDGASLTKNVVVTQSLQTGGYEIGSLSFPISQVLSKKTTTIQYDLLVPSGASAGTYIVKTEAVGFDEGGKKIEAGAGSAFIVMIKQLKIVEKVKAAEEEEVKGAETDVPASSCQTKKNYWPYALISALLLLWFVEFMRRKRIEKELKVLDHSPTVKT